MWLEAEGLGTNFLCQNRLPGQGSLVFSFSRMLRRRVPVLWVGVQEATRGRCVYVRQASASVRKRPRVSESVANRRETQNCRHFLRFASQKCQQSRGSRNAELSSLLDSSRVFASQKCQQSRGSGGSLSRNAELSSLLDSSCVFASQKCQQSMGIGGVFVAKRRTVVTFGLVSGVRVSKVPTVNGDRGGLGRETQNCCHFWTRLVSLRLKSVNNHRDRGGRGRETQNCRHFWIRLASSSLESVNSHGDRGGLCRETQNCRHFWPCLWREERREERGEKRDERREERREEREERREERGGKRGERRKER